MTETQALEFLRADPPRPGVLSVVRQDGRPHAAPIWYVLDDDGRIVFNTGENTIKGRVLRRTGYAALTVQDDRRPYSYLTVEGPVEISDVPGEVGEWAARIGGRYMGQHRAAEFGARNGVPGELLVRLHIAHFVGVLDVAQ